MEHELESKTPHIVERKGTSVSFKSDIPMKTTAHPMHHLQQTIGNRAVQRLIQAKLQVSQPGDKYEQEADHVARQVMSLSAAEMVPSTVQRQVLPSEEEKDTEPPVQRKSLTESTAPLVQRQMIPEEENRNKQPVQTKPLAASITPLAQRQMTSKEEKKEEQPLQMKAVTEAISPIVQRQEMPEEEREDQPVQMKAVASVVQREAAPEEDKDATMQVKPALQPASTGGSVDVGSDIEHRLGRSRGTGNPLPDYVRGFMEPRFGSDFSGVRVHTGHEAVQMNQALNAQAFTVGRDIYYGSGKTPSDLALTAHELTHVVQQTGAVQTKLQRACPACAAGGPPCPTCQSEQ